MIQKNKIFCLGFGKTGSSSLHKAFEMLGWKSCHHFHGSVKGRELIDRALKEGQPLLSFLIDYDAYSDLSLHRHYKLLDAQYPNSLFILNDREDKGWVRSKLNHDERWNDRNPTANHRALNEQRGEALIKNKHKVHEEITSYFKGRHDFLTINVIAGDGWDLLCPFLSVPVPNVPFPHANQAPSFLKKYINKIAGKHPGLIFLKDLGKKFSSIC